MYVIIYIIIIIAMFICTTIVVVANVRKTVYMQECMNYSNAMLPLDSHNLQIY